MYLACTVRKVGVVGGFEQKRPSADLGSKRIPLDPVVS